VEEDENKGERKEQEDNENEPMEIIKETKEQSITQNRELEEEMGESQGNIIGQTLMGTNSQKDNGNEEERIMKKLL